MDLFFPGLLSHFYGGPITYHLNQSLPHGMSVEFQPSHTIRAIVYLHLCRYAVLVLEYEQDSNGSDIPLQTCTFEETPPGIFFTPSKSLARRFLTSQHRTVLENLIQSFVTLLNFQAVKS